MTLLKTLFCVLMMLAVTPAAARTIYVGPNGDDARNAATAQSRNTPLRTIQKGINLAVGGDTVVVLDGTYNENVYIGKSGTPEQDLTLLAENKWGVNLVGWITSNDQNYITIDGLDVTNSSSRPPTKGISFGRSHHVTVRNCRVHDCYGGGIGFDRSDWSLCEWNVVFGNAFFDVRQNSGISVYQPEYRGDDNRPFGIVIRNNTSFGNFVFVNNVAFGRPTDGNGIVLDDFLGRQNGPSYNRPTLVENNLAFGNGGAGIHCFSSQNIRIRNNTIVDNVNNITFAGDLSIVESERIYVYNNVVEPLANQFAIFGFQNRGELVFNNLVGGANIRVNNINGIFRNPDFLPGTFVLRPGTAGHNAGYDAGDHFLLDVNGNSRFVENIDMGAFESE